MLTPFFFLIIGIGIIVIGFIFVNSMSNGISQNEKQSLIQHYSSLLSDMNIDYKDMGIRPENIYNISQSINALTDELELVLPRFENSDEITRRWLIDIIEEFHSSLALWTERHADEIQKYESELEDQNAPSISLLKKRLESQRESMKMVVSS